MSHARSQIRAAAIAALAGLPTTGNRVYPGRVRPIRKDSEPGLLVYCSEERSSVDAMGADPIMERTVVLAVEGFAVATEASEVEETLDQIALEVEPSILMSNLGGLARRVSLVATRILVEAPGERVTGAIRMDFEVDYRTRESTPSQCI